MQISCGRTASISHTHKRLGFSLLLVETLSLSFSLHRFAKTVKMVGIQCLQTRLVCENADFHLGLPEFFHLLGCYTAWFLTKRCYKHPWRPKNSILVCVCGLSAICSQTVHQKALCVSCLPLDMENKIQFTNTFQACTVVWHLYSSQILCSVER